MWFSDSAPRPARTVTLEHLAPFLAAVLAGLIVFYGALGTFFAQDDFLGLARAAGLAPRLAQPWRYLANQAVWDLMRPFGTTVAWPHHLLSLIVHGVCSVLLCQLLMRAVSRPAALVGAVFFAVHPFLFGALYWFSTIGDPLALCFALVTLRFATHGGARRWLALPSFALSLLAKESLLLLPVVVVAYRAWGVPRAERPGGGPTQGRRAWPINGLVLALAILALAYVVYFFTAAYGTYFTSLRDGAWAEGEQYAPYALTIGPHLWRNLLTYLGWTVAFALPVVRHYNNAVDPSVYPWGIAAAAIWLAGLALPRLRARGWLFGGTAWMLFIVPVLALKNHTYHYYLYAPLAAAAWCAAAAAEWVLGERRAGAARSPALLRPAWLAAGLAAAVLTVNGALMVRKITTMPFVLPELRASSIVDRSRIAFNVYRSLSSAQLPQGVTLLFWSPIGSSLGPHGEPLPAPAPSETYWERNVRSALIDGLAVKVMIPGVKEVKFVRKFQPAPPDCRYAVYRPEGRLGVVTPTELDSIIQETAPPAEGLSAPE